MSMADDALAKYEEIMALKEGDLVELDSLPPVFYGINLMAVYPMSGEERPWKFFNGTKIKVTIEPNRDGFNGIAATSAGELHRVFVTPEIWPFLTVLKSEEKEERKDEQASSDNASDNPDHGDADNGSGPPSGDQNQGEGKPAHTDSDVDKPFPGGF